MNVPVQISGVEPAAEAVSGERRFGGVARLYGASALAAFGSAHVTIIGIGGVGSWAAEALARSAIGQLTLIDLDHIAESNVNRQIHALEGNFGRAKIDAMAERILTINPLCTVRCIEEFVSEENVARLLPQADAVIDCIDQVRAKAALIAHCRASGMPVLTCGAGGGRADPTRIRVADLARVAGDPLLSKTRYRLRRFHGFPLHQTGTAKKFGVAAVYSDEPVRLPVSPCTKDGDLDTQSRSSTGPQGLACAGYGSSVAVTASIGFIAAATVLDTLSS